MRAKDLKHMSRENLLELLIQLTAEADELRAQLMDKDEEIAALRRQASLQSEAVFQEPGSIAEAALQMNHIFEDAQRAADQYLDTIARMQREQALRCKRLIADAQNEAEQILAEARMRAIQTESDAFRHTQMF